MIFEKFESEYFFVNSNVTQISDQTIRLMIKKYYPLAYNTSYVSPRICYESFETDVDIRYIHKMLGHSSIIVTEIYTRVALSKQRDTYYQTSSTEF